MAPLLERLGAGGVRLPLPSILSQEEVTQLIDTARTPFHHTLLMTPYGSGVRSAELTHLKVTDIDSQRMVIHVQGGKGRKDRALMLSPRLLGELCQHWRRSPQKPSKWLFLGDRCHTGDQLINTKTLRHACQHAVRRAGIKKKAYPQLLRHCFATHLLEADANLHTIQILLSDSSLARAAQGSRDGNGRQEARLPSSYPTYLRTFRGSSSAITPRWSCRDMCNDLGKDAFPTMSKRNALSE